MHLKISWSTPRKTENMKLYYWAPKFHGFDPLEKNVNAHPDYSSPNGNKTTHRTLIRFQKALPVKPSADLPFSVDIPARHSQDLYHWDTGFLCDYVVRIHHDYIQKALPVLVALGKIVIGLHGKTRSETLVILDQFNTLASDLKLHLFKEEQLIFPYIRSLACLEKQGKTIDITNDGPLFKPMSSLEEEHEVFESGMEAIRELSHDFTVPVQTSPAFSAWYQALSAFREDLSQHVQLESRVLFPKAVALQRRLTA